MTLAFNSLQKRTIQEVLEWHEFQVEILGGEKNHVLEELGAAPASEDSRFLEMTRGEIDAFFVVQQNELGFAAMLLLMAAAEAAIRVDFIDRVEKRLKDPVSKAFRAINKKLAKRNAPDRVSLEEDILDTWAEIDDNAKGPIGEFKGALRMRHWLAHGRYWDVRMGRQRYTPDDVFDISSNLLQALALRT